MTVNKEMVDYNDVFKYLTSPNIGPSITNLPSSVIEKYRAYEPSPLEIKEILLALLSGHCLTFQDLQEHPEEILNTISNFLILLQKKFVQ